jgi:hypothetical protein
MSRLDPTVFPIVECRDVTPTAADDPNGRRLLHATMPDAKEAGLVMSDGTKFPVLVGQADVSRLCRMLDHVARGLYFYSTGSRFIGSCHIIPSFIRFPNDPDLGTIQMLSAIMLRKERAKWATHGKNPDVFRFQLGPTDQYGLRPMVMTFFRGSEVWVTFQPDGVKLPFRTLDEATADDPIRIEIRLP